MATRTAGDHPELVGRSSEIAAISRAIESLESGRGHVLMLSGEPGIGKSTLARYAADRAMENSIPVYRGFAWEAGGAPAYWPWTQLLNSLVADQHPAAELTANLGKLLPGMEEVDGKTRLQPNQARFQLLESVRRLLDDSSSRNPIVLILEDLHAADIDSLHLLQYAARHIASMAVLIIGTFREIEARSMTAAEPLWATCRDAEVLALERLRENDVRDYLKTYNESEPADADVKRVFATTEGNPLFLSELVDLLSQQKDYDVRLPASVQQVIRQQIALLPDDTASLMAEAAVLGREFSAESLAAISGIGVADIESCLATSIDNGLLRKTTSGTFRFSHALHRDVLYQDIDDSNRSVLHRKYADYLRQLIDDGDEDRWAELAEHLKSTGSECRDAAIAAWRKAGRRTLQRLAFDDAVASLGKALSAFGEGPKYKPVDRYELLLECAEATLLTGDTETGHQYCRDAFEIARALEDATLMSRAALTWGSAIVVAKVDAELIAALQESLAALPTDDAAMRARIQARLAGALQPAKNPVIPMNMAREAIALARTTGDEHVMYDVLRSAISALMDFAPADERIPLNEEFGELAEKFGDVPGQFRSKLRLMIDACEAADRDRMDQAIEDCHRLAERIALPHYRWRAASARAMQATIDGDFARANSLIDAAQQYADQIGDIEAMITLPLQRFSILIEWDSKQSESLQDIESRLKEAYASGMAEAEQFITPFIASYRSSPDSAREVLRNRPLVERTFSGGDRYSLCRLGEMAAIAENREIAERAYEALLPVADGCAMPGLMGSSCTGPTAWSIGIVAASLGRNDDALRHLRQALDIAETMRAPSWVARIHRSIADVAGEMDDTELEEKHASEAARFFKRLGLRETRTAPAERPDSEPGTAKPANALALQREGDLWRVSYHDESTMLRQSKGLEMLAILVAKPGAEVHVLDLSGGSPVRDQGDAGPAIDQKARANYESRLRDLREELEEAGEFGDSARADTAREEIDFITRELSRAFGMGGRARRTGNDAERARVNVRRRLKDAIERIAKQHPEAGRYLENTIKTGTYCRYAPM